MNKDKAFWEAIVDVVEIFPVRTELNAHMVSIIKHELRDLDSQGTDSVMEDALGEDTMPHDIQEQNTSYRVNHEWYIGQHRVRIVIDFVP